MKSVSEEQAGNEEEFEEEKQLQEALIQAVRPAPRGELESLLAAELATAVFASPLGKIRHVLEAYLLLPSEERKDLFPDEKEREEFYMLYEVCISLMNTIIVQSPYTPEPTAKIPWSFPSNRAHEYLKLFINRVFRLGNNREWQEFLREKDFNYWLKKCKRKTKKKLRFYVAPANLTEQQHQEEWMNLYLYNLANALHQGVSLSLAEMIKNEFITNVMPRILKLLRTIHNQFISSDTWERTLQLIGGGKKPREPQP